MTLKAILDQLKKLGNEKMRTQNINHGAKGEQFGVRLGDIRKIAKTIKSNHELGLELWDSKNIDAMLLSILILKIDHLSVDEMDRMVQSITFTQVADWFNTYLAKRHPKQEELREIWMSAIDPMAARAGWNLTSIQVARKSKDLNIAELLDRIETEMGQANPLVQWTMNFTLGEIGIKFPEHRTRALTIGETLGIYRDYPVSKGCTSPFAPIWIQAMVDRLTALKK